jgi:hypothetical protein
MAEPTPEDLRLIAIIKSVLNEQLQPIRDEMTTTASRLHLTQEKLSEKLNHLTERVANTFAHVPGSSASLTTPTTTPAPTGTNLSSAMGGSSKKYQAGGIRMQIQNLVTASPTQNLTAQEIRDEAMDLRLRANQDFEKVMDVYGYAKVTKEGVREFLQAWDIYSRNVGIVKTIFQRFGLESLALLAEIHEDDPPPTTDGTLFREYLDRKYCDDKAFPIQIMETFHSVKMPRKQLTVEIAESYLADFLTAKRPISDRLTLDPDIQATVVLAFMNGIRPLALLRRIKKIPTTTLHATVKRFKSITTSEAEVALINITEAANRKYPKKAKPLFTIVCGTTTYGVMKTKFSHVEFSVMFYPHNFNC